MVAVAWLWTSLRTCSDKFRQFSLVVTVEVHRQRERFVVEQRTGTLGRAQCLARQWTHVPYQLPGAFGRLPHIFHVKVNSVMRRLSSCSPVSEWRSVHR